MFAVIKRQEIALQHIGIRGKMILNYMTLLVTAFTTPYCMKNCSFPPKRMLRVPPQLCVNKAVADAKKSNPKTS